jgi:hypothetical protein
MPRRNGSASLPRSSRPSSVSKPHGANARPASPSAAASTRRAASAAARWSDWLPARRCWTMHSAGSAPTSACARFAKKRAKPMSALPRRRRPLSCARAGRPPLRVARHRLCRRRSLSRRLEKLLNAARSERGASGKPRSTAMPCFAAMPSVMPASRLRRPCRCLRRPLPAGDPRLQVMGSTLTSASDRLSPPPRARCRALVTSISLASRGDRPCTMAPSSRGVK